MFDFLKRKSYSIETVNGIKKLVIAKDINNELENFKKIFEKQLEIINGIDLLKNSDIQKDLSEKVNEINTYLENVEKMEESFNALDELSKYKSLSKDLDKNISNIKKIIDKLGKSSTTQGEKEKLVKKVEEVAGANVDAENQTSVGENEDTSDNVIQAPKQEVQEQEDQIGDNVTPFNKEEPKQELQNTGGINSKDFRLTADKDPGSSKYRAEGIKERLLEINKEVVNVKTPGVTYVGGVGKDVITPGPKSTMVRVKEEVVRPNNVVQNVKIKIMRDEGEKGKLLPEKNIKMPKGDIIVKKAEKFDNMDLEKVNNLDPEKRKKLFEDLKNDDVNTDAVLEQNGVKKGSLYDQAMTKIFAEFNNKTEFDDIEEDINIENESLDPKAQMLLDDLEQNI